MSRHWVLLGSPFLGADVWSPVAVELERRGHRSTVLGGRGATPDEVLASYVDAWPTDAGDVVLVPHSNAGLYVAALADRASAVVFVDALLPGPAATTPVSTPALIDHLTPLADADGMLPAWTRWWPDDDVAALFPDAVTRRSVEDRQPLVPLTYLTGEVPTPAGWEHLPCAYLGFGDAYADELARARARGWPVAVEEGRHLHHLVAPAVVATRIEELAETDPD